MTSEKQIVANRQNAQKSTGPRSERGKHHSRRNALRHGLTAETVIDIHEERAAYRALERAINTDYRPQTNFELQLVGRLVSLLWRLRRAVAIESGLMSVQAEFLREKKRKMAADKLNIFYSAITSLTPPAQTGAMRAHDETPGGREAAPTAHAARSAEMAHSFLRLAGAEKAVFDRLVRYETSLWRQVMQMMWLLNSINRHPNNSDRDENFLYLRRPQNQPRMLWPPFFRPR